MNNWLDTNYVNVWWRYDVASIKISKTGNDITFYLWKFGADTTFKYKWPSILK